MAFHLQLQGILNFIFVFFLCFFGNIIFIFILRIDNYLIKSQTLTNCLKSYTWQDQTVKANYVYIAEVGIVMVVVMDAFKKHCLSLIMFVHKKL
jgi:hypothetical protein